MCLMTRPMTNFTLKTNYKLDIVLFFGSPFVNVLFLNSFSSNARTHTAIVNRKRIIFESPKTNKREPKNDLR